MKNNWIRKLVGGISFTSAVFIFQACYGTPQDYGMDLLIEGRVRSSVTGEPLKDITVSVNHSGQYEVTDEYGNFELYVEKRDSVTVMFMDHKVEDGRHVGKDTLLTHIPDRIFIEVSLDEY